MNFELKIVAQDEKDAALADAATTALNLLLDHNPNVDTVLSQMVELSLRSAAMVRILPPCDCEDCQEAEGEELKKEDRRKREAVEAIAALTAERDAARKQLAQVDAERAHWKRWTEESEQREAEIRERVCQALYGKVDPTITWEQMIQAATAQRKQLHAMQIPTTTREQLHARIRRSIFE